MTESDIRNHCIFLLSRREYSRHELWQKMTQKGADETRIENVLNHFQEKDYQSDERFVECFTRSRINKRQGAKKICYELQQKGISTERANIEISKHIDKQLENAKVLIERKAPLGEIEKIFSDFKVKAKITRSLVNKGYDFDIIRLAFEVLKEEEKNN